MIRSRGQVIVVYALTLLMLLGCLGLSIDGGYVFASSRAISIAADTAARAATVDVRLGRAGQSAYLSRASSDGQIIGQRNLAQAGLTNVVLTIAYNDTANAAPTAPGWSTAPPTLATNSVRATASGTYNTFFMRALGINSLNIQRVGTSQLAPVVTVSQRVLPNAVCQLDRTLSPNGPWTIWISSGGLVCNLTWHGFVNITGTAMCGTYPTWIGPPPTISAPADGSTLRLDTNSCNAVWNNYQQLNGTVQTIMIVDTLAGNTLVGCQQVTVRTSSSGPNNQATGTPVGALGSCGGVQIN
jgi:Flp pilus assembly protein TadG